MINYSPGEAEQKDFHHLDHPEFDTHINKTDLDNLQSKVSIC